MKIVTRFVNHLDSKMDEYGIEYVGVYFHKVDLEENKIVKECYPPMWNSVCMGSMLEVGVPYNSRIYILCGAGLPDDEEEEENPPVRQLDGRHCYLGSSFLDLNGKLKMWKHGPLIPDGISGKCVTLYGDIYSFGNLYLSPMLLKQGDDAWKELPKNWPHEISECEVSSPVLSDPANSRILVHLHPSYLCAFYPPFEGIQGRWDIVSTHFIGRRWGNAVTLASDGMLYAHDSDTGGHGRGTFLHAYHLPTDEFFHVSWSSLNILAPDELTVNMSYLWSIFHFNCACEDLT